MCEFHSHFVIVRASGEIAISPLLESEAKILLGAHFTCMKFSYAQTYIQFKIDTQGVFLDILYMHIVRVGQLAAASWVAYR